MKLVEILFQHSFYSLLLFFHKLRKLLYLILFLVHIFLYVP